MLYVNGDPICVACDKEPNKANRDVNTTCLP